MIGAFAITAIANPTRNMQLWVSICASVVLPSALALAIGSIGKSRIQFGGFCILAIVFYFGLSSNELPFSFAVTFSRMALERITENTTQRSAPDGTLVYQDENGRYFVRRGGTGQYEPIATDELEKSGLLKYAVSDRTTVSSSAHEGIYEHLVAMAAGFWGFILSGIAYDKRRSHEPGRS